jgi:hypothetical protein
MAQVDATLKEDARRFLHRAQEELTAGFPEKFELRKTVREAVSTENGSMPENSDPQTAFLHAYLIPRIFALVRTSGDIREDDARQSLLCRGYEHVSEYSSASPARTEVHPFTKFINTTTADLRCRWIADDQKPLARTCPDFALRAPFPFNIVFATKYFERGSVERAMRDLVNAICETFFYRALPYVPPRASAPAWDYDFGCLIACDVSYDGAFMAAWDSISVSVKRSFWDGAGVHVMLLQPPTRRAHSS